VEIAASLINQTIPDKESFLLQKSSDPPRCLQPTNAEEV